MTTLLVLVLVAAIFLLKETQMENEVLIDALKKINALHGKLHCSDAVTTEIKETIESSLYK